MSSPLGNLSPSEIEKLREALIQHDRSARPFDINNPPPTNYRHQEYPRLVYKHGSQKTPHKAVNSEEELNAALKTGFVKHPPTEVHVEEEEELSEELQQEVAAVESKLADARAKRGPKGKGKAAKVANESAGAE
jgi:hypothetical protein